MHTNSLNMLVVYLLRWSIYGPCKTEDYDVDVRPVIVSDQHHKGYLELIQEYMAANAALMYYDSKLIDSKLNSIVQTSRTETRLARSEIRAYPNPVSIAARLIVFVL